MFARNIQNALNVHVPSCVNHKRVGACSPQYAVGGDGQVVNRKDTILNHKGATRGIREIEHAICLQLNGLKIVHNQIHF